MSVFQFGMVDTYNDNIKVNAGGTTVVIDVYSGSVEACAVLDRAGVKKLRKALKKALEALDE